MCILVRASVTLEKIKRPHGLSGWQFSSRFIFPPLSDIYLVMGESCGRENYVFDDVNSFISLNILAKSCLFCFISLEIAYGSWTPEGDEKTLFWRRIDSLANLKANKLYRRLANIIRNLIVELLTKNQRSWDAFILYPSFSLYTNNDFVQKYTSVNWYNSKHTSIWSNSVYSQFCCVPSSLSS